MKLNQEQVVTLSKYLADISKILVASAVIGFFIPPESGPIALATFIIGSFTALVFLTLSITILKT